MGKLCLERAKKKKDDEFFTEISDVEKEVWNFSENFFGKTVCCPCNDGETSAFTQFFSENSEKLGLTGMTFVEFNAKGGRGRVSFDGKNWNELEGNGSFDSAEVRQLIQNSSIICTNPPFSLLRPFVQSLLELKKDFLICAPELSIAAREIAPAFVAGALNLGYSSPKIFRKPDGSKARLGNVSWLTTFDVEKEPAIFSENSVRDFPLYDNFPAREISRAALLPADSGKELLGVPISFAKKLDRRQFEVVGMSENGDVPALFCEEHEKFRRLILRRVEEEEKTN